MVERAAQEPQWRGQRDATRRRILTLLGVSLLLHMPLTPLAALFGLLSLVRQHEGPAPADSSQINAIPVSLLSDEEMKALGGTAAEPPPPPPEPATPPAEKGADELLEGPSPEELLPKPKPKPKKPEKTEETLPDGGVAHKPAERPSKEGVSSADGGVPGEQRAPKQAMGGDPMALAGAVSSVADANANVRLLVFNDRVREHPMGPRVGRLLAKLPQWSSFFGPTGLDPVRDIDRMMVFGPQLRESADVVAVLEYNVPPETMRRAIDGIVNREPKGKWLESKVPAAEARADRATRTFVLAKPGMLLMVPPRLADDALQKGPKLSLPRFRSEVALVAFVATPYRVFLNLNVPFQVPQSIKSVIIKVIPSPDGGALIEIDATDESAETARRNADLLERGVNMATQQNLGALGALLFGGQTLQLLEPIKLTADDNKIHGTAKATARQLDRMLNFAESWVDAMNNRGRARPQPAVDTGHSAPPRTAPTFANPTGAAPTPAPVPENSANPP